MEKANDDTPSVLTGNIADQVGKDTYRFQDLSGSVIVEIDDKLFRGRSVTPHSEVGLYGEVEEERNRPNEVDVKRLEIVRQLQCVPEFFPGGSPFTPLHHVPELPDIFSKLAIQLTSGLFCIVYQGIQEDASSTLTVNPDACIGFPILANNTVNIFPR